VTRFSQLLSLGLALMGLTACGAAPEPAPPPATRSAAPHEELARIVERYWNEKSRSDDDLGSAISPQFLADSLAMERGYLAELRTVPRASLTGESKLTYDMFKRGRELKIEGFIYPAELMPINGFSDMPQRFARLGAGMGQQPFSSAEDYENWLQRIGDFAVWTNQAIANMRDGMRRGYTQPRVVVERALPILAGLAADTPANPFYRPLRSMPGSIPDSERSRIESRLDAAIKDKVLPSYRALHDFLQGEYLPRARDSVAWSVLPLGEAWYAYLVRVETGTALTPAEIHRMGLAEVEHIHGRLQSLLAEIPFPGSAQSYLDLLRGDPRYAYKSPDELLGALNDLKNKVTAASPALFGAVPQSDVEIRAVAGAGTAWPLLSYRPAALRPKSPAVLDVDTDAFAAHSAGAVESMFLQEAVPGQHYQLALQQERTDLPMFRRFGNLPAYAQGWDLYAASLGDELGLSRDSEAKFESLLGQLSCALGLVIDTGLHSKGWTRRQALDYLHAQMPIDDAAAEAAVDRDIALPGEALAGEIGALKIQALRARAQQSQGARFDIRAFHAQLLKDGAMPLDMLESKVQLWIDAPP
jgi:uncharacterized protein (DUF885 family)